ncbi:MAG TPA: hypothetical protein VF573_17000, partial [Paraburkholderia sp.]|uniref:hypothetical protein n=1 Tax=Paraburkholderia sp. TaxID=1926495 RepID=UPI002ED5EC32
RRTPQRRPAYGAPRQLSSSPTAHRSNFESSRKDPDGPSPSVGRNENRRPRAGFFSLAIHPRPHFTMCKIFLRRKKSCCKAQSGPLQDGKNRFLM